MAARCCIRAVGAVSCVTAIAARHCVRLAGALVIASLSAACNRTTAASSDASTSASTAVALPAPPGSSAATPSTAPALLGVLGFATIVYDQPNSGARRLGYLRAGAVVGRLGEADTRAGCKAGWIRIEPRGFICGDEATTDLEHPVLRAASVRPRLDRPLPYRYGFVRAVTPLYLKVPTSAQQFENEFQLKDHLAWFKEHKDEVQTAILGAQDLRVDADGRVDVTKQLGELGEEKNTTEQGPGALFGAASEDEAWPFWLEGGGRSIPNISGFEVPSSAIFADRARRHTGLAFIGSFATDEHYLRRRFAVTTDLRLAPTSKVKPDAGSPWHGFELGGGLELPLGIVRLRGARAYGVSGNSVDPGAPLERRSAQRLAGTVRTVAGEKYFALDGGQFARAADIAVAVAPSKWPEVALKGEKWIEIDLSEQLLTLWRGQKAEFVTLVSSGRPAIGDPKSTAATVRGSFRIFAKHISATMDSDEGMGKNQNVENERKAGDDGYVANKGDGVYGVSVRRGQGLFQLRDVPHIQYFHKNYALHGAYWHDVFGIARSHGCINLAPADSLRVFKFTEPVIPEGWHGVRAEGTAVIVHQ
ncbi:MAG: L,D-transpeptidase [Myxococcales bacterium]|nr:L,D-transpeptidase [Myxococcales bacterium]